MARSKTEEGGGGDYRKSAEEWEILGELAERLHHFPEAVEAYQNCLRVRFSPKAMKGVLKLYEAEGKVREMLQSLIRLIAWQYRWYSEVCSRTHPLFILPSSYCSMYERLFSNVLSVLVLPSAPPYSSQSYRKRRRCQGPEHCASHQSPAGGVGPHTQIC